MGQWSDSAERRGFGLALAISCLCGADDSLNVRVQLSLGRNWFTINTMCIYNTPPPPGGAGGVKDGWERGVFNLSSFVHNFLFLYYKPWGHI